MFLTQKKEEEKSTSFSFSLPFSDFPSEIKISSFCLSLLSLSLFFLSLPFYLSIPVHRRQPPIPSISKQTPFSSRLLL
ncbi:hypothetical protein GYH30_026203 [Glycine max]|nr:hypothetical protein GYH30_026203 [Glycine max]